MQVASSVHHRGLHLPSPDRAQPGIEKQLLAGACPESIVHKRKVTRIRTSTRSKGSQIQRTTICPYGLTPKDMNLKLVEGHCKASSFKAPKSGPASRPLLTGGCCGLVSPTWPDTTQKQYHPFWGHFWLDCSKPRLEKTNLTVPASLCEAVCLPFKHQCLHVHSPAAPAPAPAAWKRQQATPKVDELMRLQCQGQALPYNKHPGALACGPQAKFQHTAAPLHQA